MNSLRWLDYFTDLVNSSFAHLFFMFNTITMSVATFKKATYKILHCDHQPSKCLYHVVLKGLYTMFYQHFH